MGVIIQATCKVDGATFLCRSATSLERGRRCAEAAARRGIADSAICHAIRRSGRENFDWTEVERCGAAELDARLLRLQSVSSRAARYRSAGVQLLDVHEAEGFDGAVRTLSSLRHGV